MRRLPGLVLPVVLAAATGCATPPPPTAGAPATLESVATYRSCAWDHLKPLQASNLSGSPVSVALMAEAACGQQREAVHAAVVAENAAHPGADAFATSYAMEARRLVLAEMAEGALKRP